MPKRKNSFFVPPTFNECYQNTENQCVENYPTKLGTKESQNEILSEKKIVSLLKTKRNNIENDLNNSVGKLYVKNPRIESLSNHSTKIGTENSEKESHQVNDPDKNCNLETYDEGDKCNLPTKCDTHGTGGCQNSYNNQVNSKAKIFEVILASEKNDKTSTCVGKKRVAESRKSQNLNSPLIRPNSISENSNISISCSSSLRNSGNENFNELDINEHRELRLQFNLKNLKKDLYYSTAENINKLEHVRKSKTLFSMSLERNV